MALTPLEMLSPVVATLPPDRIGADVGMTYVQIGHMQASRVHAVHDTHPHVALCGRPIYYPVWGMAEAVTCKQCRPHLELIMRTAAHAHPLETEAHCPEVDELYPFQPEPW